MNDWDTAIRVINIALSSCALIFLGRKALKYWKGYQSRTKDFWWVLTCWCLAVFLGSAEVLLGWDTQYRVLFTLGALVLTLKVIFRTNEIKKPTVTKEF
jgi:hypothetical protein